MSQDIKVGVAGFGLAGRVFHAPFVSAVPGLELSVLFQRSGDTAQAAYPSTRIVRSLEDLLASDIGLVVVATPNATHFEFAKAALQAGKHVVVDKPVTATSDEAAELTALALSKELVFAPFHNRRWDGDFLTVKKLIAEGTLGRVSSFESHFDRFRPVQRQGTWKEQAGDMHSLLMDLGPHLIDQALALFGKPDSVWGSSRSDRDVTAIQDAFDISLRYTVESKPLTVWLRSTMLAADPSPRLLVHGTKGSFKKLGVDPQEPAIVAGAKVPPMEDPSWLQEAESAWGTLTLAPNPAEPAKLERTQVKTERGDYRGFYANVRDAVLGAASLAVTGQDAVRALRIIEMVLESSRTGASIKPEAATW
ncbi:Gfo/Idh/MocA family oxidoreductase [Terriglobus saanensis]|uniref:Oxidoreductase domain protein n=1 Tax=Terriglobus saanensis (strain ATCC BAA-1853 / DSM 23119 / SP1PR4) TaxID=401053 RepID=E8V8J2_TERSS|nr:Gfo/Idh/MocA family oxidoreductase [Terriglobus saanensis]ADV82971.1 oxidoreductase domain protein [Terriglobus saanensis SP1PR4]